MAANCPEGVWPRPEGTYRSSEAGTGLKVSAAEPSGQLEVPTNENVNTFSQRKTTGLVQWLPVSRKEKDYIFHRNIYLDYQINLILDVIKK